MREIVVMIGLGLLLPTVAFSQFPNDEALLESLIHYQHPLEELAVEGDVYVTSVLQNPSLYLPILDSWLVLPSQTDLLSYAGLSSRYVGIIEILSLIDTPESLTILRSTYTEVAPAVDELSRLYTIEKNNGATREELVGLRSAYNSAERIQFVTLRALGILGDDTVLSDVLNRLSSSSSAMAQSAMLRYSNSVSSLVLQSNMLMLKDRWSLISMPSVPLSNQYEKIFPNAAIRTTPLNWVSDSYEEKAELSMGSAYWVNPSLAGRAVEIFGFKNETITLNINAGWNMIGGPSCDLPIGNISDPGNIVVPGSLQSYNNGYQADSLLMKGTGYWIQATAGGQIDLDCNSTSKTIVSVDFSVPANLAEIVISDASGGKQILYFGDHVTREKINFFSMPPIPPTVEFDVRFLNNSRLAESLDNYIRLQARQLPITIELTKRVRNALQNLVIEEFALGQVISTQPFEINSPIEISNTEVSVLRIRPE